MERMKVVKGLMYEKEGRRCEDISENEKKPAS